jgi:hypothetical protein
MPIELTGQIFLRSRFHLDKEALLSLRPRDRLKSISNSLRFTLLRYGNFTKTGPRGGAASMRNWGVATVVIFVLIASLAQDQHSVRMNGSDLSANCEHFRNCEHHATCRKEDLTGSGVCSGYISGVADAAISSVCVPPDANNEDIVRATIDWMDVNPSLLNRSADIIVLSALRTHFPCSAPKP